MYLHEQQELAYLDMHVLDSFVRHYLRSYIGRHSHNAIASTFTEEQLSFIGYALAESALRLPDSMRLETLNQKDINARLLPRQSPISYHVHEGVWDQARNM